MKAFLIVGSIAALALGVLVTALVRSIHASLGYDKQIEFDDGGCRLLSSPTAIEDLAPLGDGHSAFGGGGDLKASFYHGPAGAAPGAVWLINATEGTLREVPIRWGAAAVPKLVIHGLHYSQTTRRLFAVNHGDTDTGETVEIFKYVDQTLVHVASVESPLFQHQALNDVVEGPGKDEFYVTEWLLFGHPRCGMLGSLTLRERVEDFFATVIILVKFPLTRVFRCVVRDHGEWECEVATSQRFTGANGIAASPDGQRIYVNDAPAAKVTVFTRSTDGSLEFESRFGTKHNLDNINIIEADGRELVVGGSLPTLHTSVTACGKGLGGAERQIADRTVGCVAGSPGGLLVLDPRNGEVVTEKNHDGSKLSGVSTALMVGGALLLSSAFSPGVLLC
mmetsp:Transcript_34273/g.67384  ORF Transcript_34273/g.67384 Transcript_34273/m.67384 type:complete len:393 (-) Transcript_34273:85-1263(-)